LRAQPPFRVFVSAPNDQFRSGVFAAAGAYFCWGLFPLFWKLLERISSAELMAHRIVWCTATMAAVLALSGHLRFWRGMEWRLLRTLALSSSLLAVNWWVYIWAVNNGHIVESSLGYFINPLVAVLFGVVFLHEKLNRVQWIAVALAASGVLYLTVQAGKPPWIALALALSFGSYGLIRKIAVVDASRGLAIEGAWLFLPAFVFLAYLHWNGQGGLGAVGYGTDALLIVTGPITAVPLLLFAYGARRIPLSLVGILQYIGPTLQFASGVFIFGEPFSHTQLIGFSLTWIALAVYAADSLIRYAKQPPA
jgi:chloramphenicol-sensitive protein RarD